MMNLLRLPHSRVETGVAPSGPYLSRDLSLLPLLP